MKKVTNIYIDINGLTKEQLYLVDDVFAELSRDGTHTDLVRKHFTEEAPLWVLDEDGDRGYFENYQELLEDSFSENCESISYGTILEYALDLGLTKDHVERQEKVDKPNHYQLLPEYQVRDINKAILDKVQESGFDMSLDEAGWFQQAMQYFMRFYAKNGVEDLEKGVYAMDIVIKSLKGEKL